MEAFRNWYFADYNDIAFWALTIGIVMLFMQIKWTVTKMWKRSGLRKDILRIKRSIITETESHSLPQ